MNSTISMTPTVSSTITCPNSEPTEFILPDLFNDCHYILRVNPHCHPVARASEQWFFTEARIVEPDITKFRTLRLGDLIAACYPDADASHLRICSDMLSWSVIIDDWFDDCDVDDAMRMRESYMSVFRDPINSQTATPAGKMCKSFFSRFGETAGPGCTERFIHETDLFFIAGVKEVDNRAKGHIHTLESYMALRRDLIGAKPFFALIEYTRQIDLPYEVVSHPIIMAIEGAVNDYLAWSNDICSYNKEQSRHDTHNLIAVLMHDQGLDLQSAFNYAGELCKGAIQRFKDNRAVLPLWGEEIDKQVLIYVQGLQDLIVGFLHWYFDSSRYFGKDGHTVKRDRIVKLLPKRPL